MESSLIIGYFVHNARILESKQSGSVGRMLLHHRFGSAQILKRSGPKTNGKPKNIFTFRQSV